MKLGGALFAGVLVLASAMGGTAWAQKAAPTDIDQAPDFALPQREHDVALIIGIEKYRDIDAASEYSAADAQLVKSYLLSLGFRESNIKLITNDRATRTDFIKNIERWLPDNVRPDSKVFFYYSGHGSPDLSDPEHPRAFLLPYDGDPSDLNSTGYPIETLYDKLGKLKAAEVMVVLDSCFSGQGGRSVLARGARPLVNNIAPVGAVSGNMAVLTATQPNQISSSDPDKKHGILTYYFLKAIHDGNASLPDIYQKIKPKVEDDASRLGSKQSPGLLMGEGKAPGAFTLASNLELSIARHKKEEADKAARAKQAEDDARLAEQKRLADENERIKAQAAADAAAAKAAADQAAADAAARAAEREREHQAELQRVKSQQKSAPQEDPAFVPPTF
jgi:hypothetical protein